MTLGKKLVRFVFQFFQIASIFFRPFVDNPPIRWYEIALGYVSLVLHEVLVVPMLVNKFVNVFHPYFMILQSGHVKFEIFGLAISGSDTRLLPFFKALW